MNEQIMEFFDWIENCTIEEYNNTMSHCIYNLNFENNDEYADIFR